MFDFSFPRVRVITVKEFLKYATEITVIKLRERPPRLQENLVEYARAREGDPVSAQIVGISLSMMIGSAFLKVNFSEEQRSEMREQEKELFSYGAPLLSCVTAVLQPLLEFVPAVGDAFMREPFQYNNRRISPEHLLVCLCLISSCSPLITLTSLSSIRSTKSSTPQFSSSHCLRLHTTHSRERATSLCMRRFSKE